MTTSESLCCHGCRATSYASTAESQTSLALLAVFLHHSAGAALFFAGKALDFVLILGAIMLVQMIASIYLARGISARRQWGIGGIIGLSIVFIMGNFAIDFAVFIPLQ